MAITTKEQAMQLVELENKIVELEKARKVMLQNLNVVEQEYGRLSLQIAELSLEKKKLDAPILMAEHDLKQNAINLSLAKKDYWALKNELGV